MTELKELEYVLGEKWNVIEVSQNKKVRDLLTYTLKLPVQLTFSPTVGGHMTFHVTDVSKKNPAGKEQWDTADGRKGAPIVPCGAIDPMFL